MKAKHLLKCVRALNARVRALELSLARTRDRVERVELSGASRRLDRLEREIRERDAIIPASLITRHRPCADHCQGDD